MPWKSNVFTHALRFLDVLNSLKRPNPDFHTVYPQVVDTLHAPCAHEFDEFDLYAEHTQLTNTHPSAVELSPLYDYTDHPLQHTV